MQTTSSTEQVKLEVTPENVNIPLSEAKNEGTSNISAYEQFVDTKSWTKAFKIHAAIATAFSMLSFGVWFLIALFIWEYPWFLFVNCFFAITLSFHFFSLIRREPLHFHASFFVVVNLMIFLIWTFAGTDYPWFIFCYSMALPLALHYVFKTYSGSPERALYLHATFWASVDLYCFTIWIAAGGYPWFMLVFFSSAFFVIGHYCFHFYKDSQKWFLTHLGFFTNSQIMLFYIWASSGAGFPWFVFVFLPLFVAIYLHYRRYIGLKYEQQLPTQNYVPPPAFAGPYQAMPTNEPMLYPPQQPIYVPASALSNAQPIFVNSGAPPPYSTAVLYTQQPVNTFPNTL